MVHLRVGPRWGFLLALSMAMPLPVLAQEDTPAGKVHAVSGALMQRQKGKAWTGLHEGHSVLANHDLLAIPEAEIDSPGGAVRVKLLGDIGQRGILPVYEAVIQVNTNPKVDLDVTLDRGTVVFTNIKEAGAATVQLRFQDKKWTLTLRSPGTKIGLEFHGRYAASAYEGTRVEGRRLKITEQPNRELIALVATGKVFVDQGTKGFTLQAPPGPAMMSWNNLTDKTEIYRLDKLPDELSKEPDAQEKKFVADLCTCAHCLHEKALAKTLRKLVREKSALKQRFAVTAFGAIDDLPGLLECLTLEEQPDARDQAIMVLRAWMGRGPEQVEQIFNTLMKEKDLEPVQARNALHLLFGFDAHEQADPATYHVLITLLQHKALPVRELARWHLYRLAPAGRDIPYDAAAPPAARARAQAQWHKLIPDGKLPPMPRQPKAN
ncbi:MAG: hypothetical protein FJ271_00815 [Planctomycetes bacterium]|nr:hypothetical protein [Planctomycetota bacterium]